MNLMVGMMVALGLTLQAFGYVAIMNKTDNSAVHVVPAPGAVTIDGDLKEWDLSGEILMFMDESSKSAYSVRAAMMYDKDYLYIGARVKDPTPLVNNYTFGGDYAMAWNADAIQLRFFSNPDLKSTASLQTGARMPDADQQYVNHITLWHSTLDKQAGYAASYTLRFKDPVLNPPGVSGAYKRDEDPSAGSGQAAGYSFEYRIPWSVLRAPRPLTAGDSVQMQWQCHWGNDLGNAVRCGMTDVRNAASGDLGYMGPGSWGAAIFEKTGNLKRVEKTSAGRAVGHIPVSFKLEKAGKVSLAICDAQGNLVRTCLGAQPYSAGEQTWLWDGLDDADKPVPAGSYTAKLLTIATCTRPLSMPMPTAPSSGPATCCILKVHGSPIGASACPVSRRTRNGSCSTPIIPVRTIIRASGTRGRYSPCGGSVANRRKGAAPGGC